MKPGLIVYLMGRASLPEDFRPEDYCRGVWQDAAQLHLVISRQGTFELDEAWHHLRAEGCAPIYLLVADPEHLQFQPRYPLVRLDWVYRVSPPGATPMRPGGRLP